MSKISTMEDLFIHEISDIYNAEKQLTKALPKMAKAASDERLAESFETHLKETEWQIQTLEKVFELCGFKPESIKCEAMEGLVEEGEEAISDVEEGPVRDIALIVSAQKIEHYEIAAYGNLCAVAEKLGWMEAATMLGEILEQERATDEKLTVLTQDGGLADEAYGEAA